MVVTNVLHMNTGVGETSYASNSTHQRKVLLKARPVLEDALKELYTDHRLSAQCLQIADLGCSSGPNTFLFMSEIIDTLHGLSKQSNCKAPELQIYLNDLPGNDFNSNFKAMPTFYNNLKEEETEDGSGRVCFVAGVPGSFYDRLFPSNSLHFAHSSYCLHWLSQVPENLENKGNICITTTSPPKVYEAYMKQFQKDFSKFLSLRYQEMVPGGRMVLTFVCRSMEDPTSKDWTIWELLAKAFLDLVSEGLIKGEDVDSFNMPYYTPYKDELKTIIEMEGSFHVESLEVFEHNWDHNDEDNVHRSADNISSLFRAVCEPLLASHFGDLFDVFEKFSKNVSDHMCQEKLMVNGIIVSLSMK
ncbi:S-adenosyl-L-methionine-dependent methyltransferases superfamily protein [Actinidia rufa]|uniref:S-adenosyl-L-methionine-dependent methyltransferases superfamily protein n=1 Tax=Actinidia rufa TaxID=165716 RepID=A0A7J0FW21_9ERIC|nr:S-adenosyl-L-methionine-dependent methyltransferases superfamily protein [Actinidia rufa]